MIEGLAWLHRPTDSPGVSRVVSNASALLSLLLPAACNTGVGPGADKPLNVLLISVDTLRADHLGAYGYELPTSPNIDRLASQGTLFEVVFAHRGQTWPSLSSILTSRYPHSHGVRKNGVSYPPEVRSIARILREQHGYETAAFLTHMKRAELPGFTLKRGFKGKRQDAKATDAAIDWLAQYRSESPFFVWVHYFAPHRTYDPPAEFESRFAGRYDGLINGRNDEQLASLTADRVELSEEDLAAVVALYDGEIAYVDHEIGRLLGGLERTSVSDHTLVVFTTDHGEELYDHNYYFWHSCSIYDSVLRLAWIVRSPGVVEAGRRVSSVTEAIDIAPTMMNLLGFRQPPDFEGRNYGPLLRGEAGEPNDEEALAYAEIQDGVAAIRTKRWYYVENPDGYISKCAPFAKLHKKDRPVYEIAARELYDLAADPNAQNNVIDRYPMVAAELRTRLLAWPGGPRTPMGEVTIPEEVLRRLRALGYVH